MVIADIEIDFSFFTVKQFLIMDRSANSTFYSRRKVYFCLAILLLFLFFFVYKFDAPCVYAIDADINNEHPCVCLAIKEVSTLKVEVRNFSTTSQVYFPKRDILLTYYLIDEQDNQIKSEQIALSFDKFISSNGNYFVVQIPEMLKKKLVTILFCFSEMSDACCDLRISTLSSWRRKPVLQLVKLELQNSG